MMKKASSTLLILLFLVVSMSGCARRGPVVWDDTRTASRHVARGLKVLCGVDDESRMVRSRDDFECGEEYCYIDPEQLDFVPLMVNEDDSLIAMADTYAPQPKREPGEAGGKIPGIEHFRDPATIQGIPEIFHNLTFPFDSSVVRGEGNIRTVKNIAEYLGKYPGVFVFVEGHCDERGADAYNLALGSRRANTVRKMLLKEGISPDRVFTISYGKERPLLYGHDDYAWTQNRRVEFKVFHHD